MSKTRTHTGVPSPNLSQRERNLNGWREVKLGDLGTVVTGKTPSKNNPEDWGDETLFITPSDFGNYQKWANDSIRKLSTHGMERLSNKVLPVGSILVTCIGSDMGKVVMNRKDAITNQQINSIVPNTDIVNLDFAYYLLVDLYETLRIYGGDGTAVPIVNKGDFENIDALIPEKEEQKAIAEVLSSLDDKIDLLHRQNKTLEDMVQALFRKWFIEEAKEDWDLIKLDDLVDTINGYSYKGKELIDNSDEALVTLKNFGRDGSFQNRGFKPFSGSPKKEQEVKIGDLIVAHTDLTQNADVLGNPALVFETGGFKRLYITMDVVRVIPKTKQFPKSLLYFLMKTKEFKGHCVGYSNGSTVLHLSKKAIPEFEMLLPSKLQLILEKIQFFDDAVNKIISNQSQIRTLENLRDTLLPKLMSGAVRVKYSKEANLS